MVLSLLLLTLLGGCATVPPADVNNVCTIFGNREEWYENVQDVKEKWGTPIHVQMAIVHQESKFKHDAKPPRTRLLWIIPWTRPSTAFGYAQVLDATWDWYREDTGNWSADRDDFGDAVDFIGWYSSLSQKKLGISKWDAENQYLAYHEGHKGYARKTFKKKKWLMRVAKKVHRVALRYRDQLNECRDDLKSGWSLWPF